MAITLHDSGADTAATATKASASFTPTAGALLVVAMVASGHTTFDAGGCTSSLTGHRFTRPLAHARKNASADSVYLFFSDQPARATSQTVTLNTGSDSSTGIAWGVWEVTGVARYGIEALRGHGIVNNGTAGGTPTVTLLGPAGTAQNALSTNACIMLVGNGANPAGLTAPGSFNEDFDTGYDTPTTGIAGYSRVSGHTASTIALGATSGTAYGAVGVEIDTTTTQTIKPVSFGTVPSAAGTGTGTTSCAPDYPPDMAEGDIIVLTVSIKPETATAPDLTASSFTKVTDSTGGTGAAGVDTGPTRCAVYYRVAGATPPTGTLTVTPGGTPNNCWAHMRAYRSSHGASVSWSVAGNTADDASAGATFTGAPTDPGIAVDDLVEVSATTPTDVNMPGNFTRKYNASDITGTGLATGIPASSGPSSQLASNIEGSTTNGNDAGGGIFRFFPTSALSSGNPTFTTTATGTTTNVAGPIHLVRFRASAAAAPTDPIFPTMAPMGAR